MDIRELVCYLDQDVPHFKEEARQSVFICSRRSDIFQTEKFREPLA